MIPKPALWLALALSMTGISAHAETLSEWSFGSPKTASGLPLCSAYVSAPKAGSEQMLAIQKYSNQNLLNLKLFKRTWDIPADTKITVTIDFAGSDSLTLSGLGKGQVVGIEIPGTITAEFLASLRESSYLRIGFPKGSESGWSINLSDAGPHLVSLNLCALKQREEAENSQPF